MREQIWNSKNLNHLLSESGVTTRQIAEMTKMSTVTVTQWRQGTLYPSLKTMIQLAEFFAVPLDYLVGRCDMDLAQAVEKNYKHYFKQLRTDAFEVYLTAGHKETYYEDKIIPMYPYNLLEDLFGEPWNTPLNPLQEKGLEKAFSMLTERERNFLRLYYSDDVNFKEIGGRFNLTRERVRQIINRGMQKLRHPTASRMIKDGYDEGNRDRYLAAKEHELETRKQALDGIKKQLDHYEEMLKQRLSDLGGDPDNFRLKYVETSLEDLQLSARSYNCLRHAGMRTLQDILDYRGDFFRIRNLGRKSIEEIRDVVYEMTGINICNGKENIA